MQSSRWTVHALRAMAAWHLSAMHLDNRPCTRAHGIVQNKLTSTASSSRGKGSLEGV